MCMKTQKRISIIIPVHNARNTLKRCVDSLISQSYGSLQVILVENGSTDGSYSLCMELKDKHEEVECMQVDQTGVSAARNAGLRHAEGDIIGFCDADDYYYPDSLIGVAEAFEQNSTCDMVICGYRIINGSKQVVEKGFSADRVFTFQKLARYVITDKRIMGSVWNKFIRKELVAGVLFDERLSYCEDTHFLLRVLTGHPDRQAIVLNKFTYAYWQSSESLTNSEDKLFDSNDQLKYIITMDRILSEMPLSRKMRWLISRTKYISAYETACRFQPRGARGDSLKKTMRDNFLYLFLTFGTDTKKTIKMLCKQLLKRR